MNKFIVYICTIIAALLLLCACSSSDSDTVTEQRFPSCFAYVNDMTTGVDATYSQVGYTLRLNYTNLTAEVDITNLRTTDGNSYSLITLQNVPWTIDRDGCIKVSGSNIPAKTGTGSSLVFSSFNIRLTERMVDNQYSPGFVIYYTIDMRHAVLSSNQDQVIFGKTISTSDSGKPFETENTVYKLYFNADTRRLNLSMLKASFIGQMPAMNIDLENIPFTFEGQSARFSVDNIIPKIGGKDYPSFPISNLKGQFNFGNDFTLTFICDPAMAPGKYDVSANCSFNFQPSK